ncbi:MAG: type II 3-dehydroquinate dehydratase [bacterium]
MSPLIEADQNNSEMKKVVIIHGPNLDRLGKREQGFYGDLTLEQINEKIKYQAADLGLDIDIYQSNNESEIVEYLRKASSSSDGIILNPAGFGHSSLVLRDAVIMSSVPVIEVHLSNIHARESFRSRTLTADVCIGQITGFKWVGYCAALFVLKKIFEEII